MEETKDKLKSGIYLFDGIKLNQYSSVLSEYINYLKYNRIKGPYKFVFISSRDYQDKELFINEVINTLTSESEYIFIENPEKFLDLQNSQIIFTAFKNQIKLCNTKIFISSSDAGFWHENSSFQVTKSQNFCYITTSKEIIQIAA